MSQKGIKGPRKYALKKKYASASQTTARKEHIDRNSITKLEAGGLQNVVRRVKK